MNKTLAVSLLIMFLAANACAPVATPTPRLLSNPAPTISIETQIPVRVSPTEANPAEDRKRYANDMFGLSFNYPSDWFGPSEYVSDETLRVEVGSDVVYPYGEPPEQPSGVKDSYNVVVQYAKNNQNTYWKGTYQSLLNLADGESLSDARSLLTRVRQLEIGRFKGFEYITTLSETAQTDRFYTRSVILLDEQTNDLLTITGQPINVEINNPAEWGAIYRGIDEANQALFEQIVESLTIE